MDDAKKTSAMENEEEITINLGSFQMTNNKLGSGGFGTVYLGIHKGTKENVAIKEIRKKQIEIVYKTDYYNEENDDDEEKIKKKKEEMYADLLKNEIEILEKLHHPYIMRMLYKINYNEDYYIVSEYLSGKDYLKRDDINYTEKKVCKIFCQILSALEYLHQNYIVHRDVKLENIMFDEYEDAKLIDFGFSKHIKENEYLEGFRGSKLYAAPETVFSDKYVAFPTDIWSLGICIYVMLFEAYPFGNGAETEDELLESLAKEDLNFPGGEKISDECKNFLKKLLEKDPKKRLNIDKIKQDPWLRIIDFDFKKSCGINLKKDIIPIDLEIVREMGGNDEQNLRKIIKDILTNSHNKNTCAYYLKIDQKKRKNIKSIADIRPSSDLFVDYINSEKSKLKYYNNDLNKVCEELTKKILDEIQKEAKAFVNIKESIIDEAKKIENENNNKDDNKNKETNDKKDKKKGIMKIRSRSLGKLTVVKKNLKEDNSKGINIFKNTIMSNTICYF